MRKVGFIGFVGELVISESDAHQVAIDGSSSPILHKSTRGNSWSKGSAFNRAFVTSLQTSHNKFVACGVKDADPAEFGPKRALRKGIIDPLSASFVLVFQFSSSLGDASINVNSLA